MEKKKWQMEQVKEGMGLKEMWGGVKTLRSEYEESVYAMKDKDGDRVLLKDRAEALADYLKKKSGERTTHGKCQQQLTEQQHKARRTQMRSSSASRPAWTSRQCRRR